jgi:hypothetical protein
MKIYVVVEHGGEWSDKYMINVCAFLDTTNAQQYADKKNADVERIKKAERELFEHMNKWDKKNEIPMFDCQDEFYELGRITYKNKRIQTRYDELKKQADKFVDDRKQFHDARMLEQNNFYLGLNYLTEEDKNNLTDPEKKWQYGRTDSEFVVEELEIKDQ